MKELINFLNKLFEIIKLETMTTAGRVNLASIGLLVLFVIAYTTNDMLCYSVSAIRDVVKTVTLGENISDPYETISVFKVMMPVVMLSVLCIIFFVY